MSEALNPVATKHLPIFITPPGESDVLMNVTIVLLVAIVLLAGNFYLRLHALPERMAHRANLVQFEIVAVLALLALLTHNNVLWVAALLLALIRIPDFSTPLNSIADSLDTLVVSSGAKRQEPAGGSMAVAMSMLEAETARAAEEARPAAKRAKAEERAGDSPKKS